MLEPHGDTQVEKLDAETVPAELPTELPEWNGRDEHQNTRNDIEARAFSAETLQMDPGGWAGTQARKRHAELHALHGDAS
eukprot:7843368-Alexandrium_andersonii.AAC.1